MVNTKEYTPNESDYLKVDIVKQSPTKIGTILPGSGWNEFNNKDEKTGEQTVVEKPYINVELDGKAYEWTLNRETNERLAKEFDSWDTDDWVGEQVKLLTNKNNNYEFITATSINK